MHSCRVSLRTFLLVSPLPTSGQARRALESLPIDHCSLSIMTRPLPDLYNGILSWLRFKIQYLFFTLMYDVIISGE